jgi:hypothetical protein
MPEPLSARLVRVFRPGPLSRSWTLPRDLAEESWVEAEIAADRIAVDALLVPHPVGRVRVDLTGARCLTGWGWALVTALDDEDEPFAHRLSWHPDEGEAVIRSGGWS